MFQAAGERVDPDGGKRTLHRLRHAGISHAVGEENVNLGLVRAKSRHGSLRSLEPYATPSVESIREMTDALDLESRRRG